jgi:hypothetical protein
MTIPNVEEPQLSEAEKSAAIDRAIRACAMCPESMWEALAKHMAMPGIAVSTGMILKEYPEAEWGGIIERTQRRTELLMEFLSTRSRKPPGRA